MSGFTGAVCLQWISMRDALGSGVRGLRARIKISHDDSCAEMRLLQPTRFPPRSHRTPGLFRRLNRVFGFWRAGRESVEERAFGDDQFTRKTHKMLDSGSDDESRRPAVFSCHRHKCRRRRSAAIRKVEHPASDHPLNLGTSDRLPFEAEVLAVELDEQMRGGIKRLLEIGVRGLAESRELE